MTSGPPSEDGILVYYLPPAELLPRGPGHQQPGPESFRVAEAAHATLREFGVDAQVTEFAKEPVFTCFEIEAALRRPSGASRSYSDEARGEERGVDGLPVPADEPFGRRLPRSALLCPSSRDNPRARTDPKPLG